MKKNEIQIIYGKDPYDMAFKLMESCELASMIGDRDRKIGLKPNLITSSTADHGAVTHPEIVVAVIEYLQDHGFRNIKIIESSWVGDNTRRAFAVNGYNEISAKYNVPLVDVKTDAYDRITIDGITMEISKQAIDLDFLINLPVLKGHCQTLMTCALKNMKGLLSDRSKRQFHSLGLHKPIAALNKAVRQDFIIVDSLNGDLDFEEGGTPVYSYRMFAGSDPLLMDCYCATQIGFSPDEIGYIRYSRQLGVGEGDLSKLSTVELNEAICIPSRSTGRAKSLERYVKEDSACSACYANLINALARMDENGDLRSLAGKDICIGQGYRGKSLPCIGVGNCTGLFDKNVPGCPPSATAIREKLESLI